MVFDNDALRAIVFRARQASIELSKTSGHLRNLALLKIADALCDRKDEIIDAAVTALHAQLKRDKFL